MKLITMKSLGFFFGLCIYLIFLNFIYSLKVLAQVLTALKVGACLSEEMAIIAFQSGTM